MILEKDGIGERCNPRKIEPEKNRTREKQNWIKIDSKKDEIKERCNRRKMGKMELKKNRTGEIWNRRKMKSEKDGTGEK